MYRLTLNEDRVKSDSAQDVDLIVEWLVRMPDKEADQLLVEFTAHEMRKKLREKRESGRGG